MDLQAAYAMFGLPLSASFDEVKNRYRQLAKQLHPDVSPTHDSRPFVVLTTAYYLILDEHQGGKKQSTAERGKTVDEEIASSSVIQEHVQKRFGQLKEEFQAFLDQKVDRTRERIANLINSAGSGSTLKGIVQESVAKVWIDMVKEMEYKLRNLCHRATTEDKDFLYALFSDLYAEQRRFWLTDLYRNPAILFCVASFLLLCAAPAYPQLAPLAATFRLETMPWVTFAPLLGGLCFVLIRLRQLNPRHQFLPPRLSAFEVQTQTRAIAQGIGQDLGEAMLGGAAAGALIGSFVPGIGTLVGAGVGVLFGLFSGESLENMKERVWEKIDTEMGQGLEQLHDRLLTWIERQETQYTKAATESFARNIKRVAHFFQSHNNLTKQLTAEVRLLLPGPEARSEQRSETTPSPVIKLPTQSAEVPSSRDTETHFLSLVGNGVLALLIVVGGWAAVKGIVERVESPEALSTASSGQLTVGTTDTQIIVSTEKANLRSGPGTTFAVVGQVRRGEIFSIAGQDGEWYKLFHGGQAVWLHQSLVKQQTPRPDFSPP